jgi:hypothetical protein
MQLAQRERRIDPQMLERLAEECAAERSVAKGKRRALDVAATHIESEIPHEIGNTPGVEIDANHRITDSVEQRGHVTRSGADLEHFPAGASAATNWRSPDSVRVWLEDIRDASCAHGPSACRRPPTGS